jgi:hypothetical protein
MRCGESPNLQEEPVRKNALRTQGLNGRERGMKKGSEIKFKK